MNVRHFNTFEKLKRALSFCVAGTGIVAGIICMDSQGLAQSFADPLKINWISGPQQITIGSYANVNIPSGYRFADGNGARIILESENNPVPNDLIGIIAANSGKWCAVMEYSPKGYVKNPDTGQLNTTAVLKDVQKQFQSGDSGTAITALNWNSQPAYDPLNHSLAWSLQVQTPSSKVLNETSVLLGRHGILEVTDARAYPLAAGPSLTEIMPNIAFPKGERYSDYQAGDKVSEIGLSELITGKNDSTGEFTGAAAAWIYSGLSLLVLGGLVVLWKKSRRRSAAPRVPVAANANGASIHQPVLQNGELNGDSHQNGEPVVAKQGNRGRRKRIFDYPRFYTNVMNELSFHSYGGNWPLNGKANGKVNGANGNGHTNGHANGHSNGSNGSGINESIKAGIEELILTQKNLIQEQKCLLEQQTKLIEQKRWLIEEQTAFFKGQSGIISERQFPLKFE